MKDQWLEMLFDLFEKGLNQIRKYHTENSGQKTESVEIPISSAPEMPIEQTNLSLRVMAPVEQNKLTNASHQLLMRMKLWDILSHDAFEHVMNILLFSESSIVTLHETKWAIRKVLGEAMDAGELAFLDLILNIDKTSQALH